MILRVSVQVDISNFLYGGEASAENEHRKDTPHFTSR